MIFELLTSIEGKPLIKPIHSLQAWDIEDMLDACYYTEEKKRKGEYPNYMLVCAGGYDNAILFCS